MKCVLVLLAGLSAVVLSACETYEPVSNSQLDVVGAEPARVAGAEGSYSPFNYNPVAYSGITGARLVFATERGPVTAEIISGKEAEGGEVRLKTPDGTEVSYSATGLRAFEGQATRADVEKALAASMTDLWTNLAPEIKSGLVTGVCLAFTGGMCP